ncbi:DUF3467 domain-containing protein [Candidatus Falkowbacteria bacterium]|jgi:hypothetical protein|nr:DUF3467 domain-containing protein [Candidatus Falkowbacteria bacterium]MBT4432885.1 DUF3467 domain-containing protein [Candidatus Falkowbacteria bacterium]
MQNQQQPAQGGQAKQEVKIADNIPGAEYANFMQTNHNKEEFQLVFGNIMAPSGRVVSKIITTPGHFKRIISAMQANLKKYEEKFGEVKESAPVESKEIGFADKQ